MTDLGPAPTHMHCWEWGLKLLRSVASPVSCFGFGIERAFLRALELLSVSVWGNGGMEKGLIRDGPQGAYVRGLGPYVTEWITAGWGVLCVLQLRESDRKWGQ